MHEVRHQHDRAGQVVLRADQPWTLPIGSGARRPASRRGLRRALHGQAEQGVRVEEDADHVGAALVPLPERYDAPAMARALTPVIAGLPDALRRSL
jgi:hypothetical protein